MKHLLMLESGLRRNKIFLKIYFECVLKFWDAFFLYQNNLIFLTVIYHQMENQILFYNSPEGKVTVTVTYLNDTFWLSQKKRNGRHDFRLLKK